MITRRIVAAALAAHGLIHLIGFVVPWQLVVVDGFAYRTTAFGGALSVGDGGARVIGLAWLALAAGFVIAGIALFRNVGWALPLAAALALGSLAVCAMGLPETAPGIAVNAVILGAIAVARVWPVRTLELHR
jgi:hypothetical protein